MTAGRAATWAALLAVVVLAALAGCRDKRARVEPPATESIARGKTTVGQLKKGLLEALTRAMATGVPAAIAACNIEAPALAAALAVDGVVVGRATHKPRNPKNRAAGWTVEALTRFETMRRDGRDLAGASYARRLPDGRTAYAEPLVIQELCLACHGAQLAPEVTAALTERYPGDEATGYQVGDLRGVVWVELPPRL